MKALADAFEYTLQEMYDAGNAIAKSAHDVISAASRKELTADLTAHLDETKGQVETLEKVFKTIGKKPSGEKRDAIEGLIEETESVMSDAKGASAKDAALIGCCRPSSLTRSLATVRTANGRSLLAMKRSMTC